MKRIIIDIIVAQADCTDEDMYSRLGLVTTGREPWTEPSGQPRLFGGKERRRFQGLNDYDFGPRYLDSPTALWSAPDKRAHSYPWLSPWSFCAGNPIRYVDPSGEAWYSITLPIVDLMTEEISEQTFIRYTTAKNQKEFDESGVIGNFLGEVFVDFHGSRNEKLGVKNGKGGFIDGEGAVSAEVTVYGPNGEDDISKYIGYSMSSDFEKYGAIADGMYTVKYLVPGKTNKLKSNYAINGSCAVDCLDGVNPNPSPNRYSPTQKDGVYIHSTNKDGTASGHVSEGCLLIMASQWEAFKKQIGKRNFKLLMHRDK